MKYALSTWIIVLMSMIHFQDSKAQSTNIPDPAFEQALIDLGIDSQGILDGQVLISDVNAVQTLNVSNKSITSLFGINEFTQLRVLNCAYNNIAWLNVSSLTQLREITATFNQLNSINVNDLPNLEKLYIPGNLISSLDISQNPNLTDLNTGSNPISSVDLSNNPLLVRFVSIGTQLTSLDVSVLSSLQFLNIQANQISSLDLSACPLMLDLKVGDNLLSSLDISNMPQLNYLDAGGNELTSLDLSSNTALIYLFSDYNQLTSLDLSNSHSLERFNSIYNDLQTLNMQNGNNANMDFMIASNNPALACIQVDDAAWSDIHWPSIDPASSFSEDCSIVISDCSVFDTAPLDLNKSISPVDGVQDRIQLKWYKASPQIRYSDEDDAACDIKFWAKYLLDPVTAEPISVSIQNPDTILLENVRKVYEDLSPKSIYKWPVKFRADDANNAKRVDPNVRYTWKVRCACEQGLGQESPCSDIKIFNTPDFDPVTGIFTPPPITSFHGKAPAHTRSMDEEMSAFKLYPNPSNGSRFFIQFNEVNSEEKSSLKVMDTQGMVLLERQLDLRSGSTIEIAFDQAIPQGFYLIQWRSGDSFGQEKLMVQ